MISKHATFISRDHVFYVDVSVFTSVFFEELERVLNELAYVVVFLLPVVNPVPDVYIPVS